MLAHSYLYVIASGKDSNYNVVGRGMICSVLIFFVVVNFYLLWMPLSILLLSRNGLFSDNLHNARSTIY